MDNLCKYQFRVKLLVEERIQEEVFTFLAYRLEEAFAQLEKCCEMAGLPIKDVVRVVIMKYRG